MASPSTNQPQVSNIIPDDTNILQATLKSDNAPTLNIVPSTTHENEPTKAQATDLRDTRKAPEDTSFKPTTRNSLLIAVKYEICTPLLRYPLTLKRLQKTSTFLPVSINYFQIVHYMDQLMSTNIYFTRMGLPWHPLLSRLYFSEIFFIQVLRAMRHANIGSSSTRMFTEQLLKDYPPESLPIPGPLLPVLQSIAACESDDPLYGLISPILPNDIGYNPASDLLDITQEEFIFPNIPVITAFLNTIIHAEGDIPNYSEPSTFDDSENHTILGHAFEAENWQLLDRLVLLSPGLNCQMESSIEIDENMHTRGQELDIPIIRPEDNVTGIERYMLLDQDATWFRNVRDVMATYCSFFKESASLGNCSPHGPTSGLLRSRMHNLSSANAQNNIVNNLDQAFPGEYPLKLQYKHETFELSMPQNYCLIGQLAAINTSISYRGLNTWGDLNNQNSGRSGPYWNQGPSLAKTQEEENLLEVEALIASHYFKEEP